MRFLHFSAPMITSLLCLSLQAQEATPAPAPAAQTLRIPGQQQLVAMTLSRIMESNHYSKIRFDDTLSSRVFEEFLVTLDPQRRIFLASDIAEFTPYRAILDDQFKEGDLTFAVKVFQRYTERLQERIDFVHATLAKQLDTANDESLEISRDKANWPKNREEQDNLWRRTLENEWIVAELSAAAELKRQERLKAKNKPVDTAPKRPPQEQIVRRYDNFLKSQKDFSGDELAELIINVMTRCFDPHSSYFGPKAMEEFDIAMKLSLSGIGATLQWDDGYTKITDIMPGSPAELGGQIQIGDRLIEVGQGDETPVNVVDMRLSKVVSLVRGQKGTTVTLIIARGGPNGERKTIKIVRDKIKLTESEAKGEIRVVESQGRQVKVGVVRLPAFYDGVATADGKGTKGCSDDVKREIIKMKDLGAEAIVLDLRENGGGSLGEAVKLTGLFIDQGPVVQIRDTSGEIEVLSDEDPGALWEGPLVVMVNDHSASASEIVAAAIQDHKRGAVVGVTPRTHGKGTVQRVIDLSRVKQLAKLKKSPGEIKLTIAKFYRVNGGSTQEKGVEPDIVLPGIHDEEEGEIHLRHHLPYDQIPSIPVAIDGSFIKNLVDATKLSLARRTASPEFKTLETDIARFDEREKKGTLSLKKETRVKEFQDEEVRREQLRPMYNQIAGIEKGEEDEDEEALFRKNRNKIRNDVYLREGEAVAADLVKLRADTKVAAKP